MTTTTRTVKITWVEAGTKNAAMLGLDETIESADTLAEIREAALNYAAEQGVDLDRYDVVVEETGAELSTGPLTCTIRLEGPPAGVVNAPAIYRNDGTKWRLVKPGTQYLDGAIKLAPEAFRLAAGSLRTLGFHVDTRIGGYVFEFRGGEFGR